MQGRHGATHSEILKIGWILTLECQAEARRTAHVLEAPMLVVLRFQLVMTQMELPIWSSQYMHSGGVAA